MPKNDSFGGLLRNFSLVVEKSFFPTHFLPNSKKLSKRRHQQEIRNNRGPQDSKFGAEKCIFLVYFLMDGEPVCRLGNRKLKAMIGLSC